MEKRFDISRLAVPAAPVVPRQKIAVGVHHVAVGGDEIGHVGVPARLDARHPVALDQQPLHRPRHFEPPAELLEEPHQCPDQRAGPAAREPHPALPLQRMDQRVDRGGRERVAADEERVEREDLPQFLRA
jgi:hypothetical protein